MTEYQVFKVVKILDNSIVINAGLDKNLSLDDEIEIFVEGEEIFDPYNDNQPLGTLDFIKETLTIIELSKYFAVCAKLVEKEIYHPSHMERITRDISRNLGNFGGGYTEKVIKRVNLNVKKDEITERVTTDQAIQLGDTARVTLT